MDPAWPCNRGNTTITRLVVSVDDPDNGDDPIRSTHVPDAFFTGLARNRSIQVFHTSGLEYLWTNGNHETILQSKCTTR